MRRQGMIHGLLPVLCAAAFAGAVHAQDVDPTGTGWVLERLDLDVSLHPVTERLSLNGDLLLRLEDHARSSRLVLVMNARDSIMAFDSVSTDRGSVTAINPPPPGRPSTRSAIIDFPEDAPARGDVVRVRVHASSRNTSAQFSLAEDVMLASWVTGWYPIPLPSAGRSLATAARVPGTTSFDMPTAWRVVANGARIESRVEAGRMRETWVTTEPLARSFAAAPYRVVEGEVAGRTVELYLLTIDETGARTQAHALAGAIAALERRWGPYPTGSYAIAEVPGWVPGFLAASEQGFMMAKPENFGVAGGNIPLFAHEAAHGYWGNLVSSTGPGSAFLTESLAQYGAVIALEEMLGPDSALAFLKFSREGYLPLQSARGYFEVVRRRADSVAIADLRNLDGTAKRIVVNSKGVWVLHMLRDLVGDERFFATLAEYLRDHRDVPSTVSTFRSAFARAAPEEDVAGFFAQWLDRTGAPRLDISWSVVGEEVEVVVEQTQDGAPFALTLDLRIRDAAGRTTTHAVEIDSKREVLRLPAPRGVDAVSLDPGFKILRWDEVYRMDAA